MNINPMEVRSVLNKLESVYMEERNRKGCCNYTNPYIQEQEEIAASLFILIIVGFFGFLLFTMMISNIVSRQRLNYTDYLYQEKFQGNGKRPSSKDVLAAVNNNGTSEACNSKQCQKINSCILETETSNTNRGVINV